MKKQINIIIAEDHDLFRKLLIDSLERFNIRCISEAKNGIELIAQLKVYNPDVVLIDVDMPEMNGYQAIKKVKELSPHQRIIVLTQHDNKILEDYFIENGAESYLTKCADIEVIVEAIIGKNNSIKLRESVNYEKKRQAKIKFSTREEEVISLLCEGKSNKEIAQKLGINSKTVEVHKKNLFRKTNTFNAVQCVSFLIKEGLNNIKTV